ncbi:F-box/WD repeat-containing protein 5-like [Helicoverpa zea]|uniref:F-box/WD repeat-containing protein 5-like n=1 Tax=Helicoverpa zea TaxID=7113 RepID=UPI001F596E18|nr:F-box/WD repeat-containing protein 5-like [Helicoverpa zea]
MSVWQSEEQRCGVVLREVFAWLEGRELAQAGAACRAWRRAAAAPALWRRLLVAPPGTRTHACALITQACVITVWVYTQLDSTGNIQRLPAGVSWRQEYVRAHAGWRAGPRHRAGAPLLHAALAPGGALLALAAADATLLLWAARAGAWAEAGRADLRARGWATVARSQWATAGRLLLTGSLSLVSDWELLVLHVDDDGGCGTVYSRVRCSAGAAGCWADPAGEAFLSFELHRLGAGIYCTTVWLNAATQETESEYAGVTSPLLRIFNEEGAHLTHALVVQSAEPLSVGEPAAEPAAEADGRAAYLRAIAPRAADELQARVLVAGAGCRLGAWPVRAPRPPPLQASAGGGLAERVRRQRERRAAPEPDAPEPDEAAVRAGCTPPARLARLHAPLVGLALQER